MSRIEAYREIAPQGSVEFLLRMAERIGRKKILHMNSTKLGGGVAEILRSLVPLLESVGLDAQWDVITGNEEFFSTTKAFHNALQGQEQRISSEMLQNYLEINRENGKRLSLEADFMIIHDPQPAALIESRPDKSGKWVWRCRVKDEIGTLLTVAGQHLQASPLERTFAKPTRRVPRTEAGLESAESKQVRHMDMPVSYHSQPSR